MPTDMGIVGLLNPLASKTHANMPAFIPARNIDGIPLAIELAAARVRVLTVEQIAARLDDRFRLLTGGSRIDLPRHQTLRALIDWSYDLLEAPERRLFNRLAVFAGSWTLDALEVIGAGEGIDSGDVLELLAQLVYKSLVVAEEGLGPAREVRYRLLETLQQYAAEKLRQSGEEAILRRRHQDCYLALAERGVAHMEGPDGQTWALQLEAEHDNLRAALRQSRLAVERADDTDGASAEVGLRLAGALWPFWERRGYWSEGRRWLEGMLSTAYPRSLAAIQVKVLHGAATLADSQGDPARSKALLEEALALHQEIGDRLGVVFTMDRLGQAAYRQGDLRRAMTLAENSLGLYREIGDEALIADALDTLGHVVRRHGDHERATALYEESLALFRKLSDKRGIAVVLRSLVQLADERGEYARVAALAEESVALFREVGDSYGLGSLLLAWALAAARQGDYERAERLLQEGLSEQREGGEKQAIAVKLRSLATIVYQQKDYERAISLWKESLALHRDLGDEPGIAVCFSGLGELAGETGQLELAVRLFAAADAFRPVVGATLGLTNPEPSTRAIAAAHARLGDEVFAATWAKGQSMPLEQAISEGLALELPADEERAPAKENSGRSSVNPAGLTRREADVLRLIAAGRTSNQIAAELVITVPTVERHITHIYEKIGARGRADATSYALKHALA